MTTPPIPTDASPTLDEPTSATTGLERKVLTWAFPATVGPYTLTGCSRARDATAFVVPELGLVLDAGERVHGQLLDDVFLTHTHSDHVHALARVKARRKPPRIHAPAHALDLIERYFLATQELTDNQITPDGFVREPAYALIGREAGDAVDLSRRGQRLRVRAVATDHSVPSLGYLFYEVRDKLKAELAGLAGPAIADLRREGVKVTEEVERPLFGFLGDTTAAVFERHPEVLELPVVVTECTFLTDEDSPRGERTRHTCWATLAPFVEAAPRTVFVLTHMSLRYPDADLARLTAPLRRENVVWWM